MTFSSCLIRELRMACRDCPSALLGVGLDPAIGFMHADRPGRDSLALDFMEELRPVFVGCFVLMAISNRLVGPSDFAGRGTGEIRSADEARKALFQAWQERKREQIVHLFTKEKIPRGLVPTCRRSCSQRVCGET